MPNGGGPAPKGYGRELIEQALPYQLKARTMLEFGEDGVRCEVVFDADGAQRSPRA